MLDWAKDNPEFVWLIFSGVVCLALYWVGDKRWAPKAKEGRTYAIEPTKDEERAAKKDAEDEIIRLCNDEYVRRTRYHDDMNILTAQIGKIEIEVGKFGVVAETMARSMEQMAESSAKQADKLHQICEHTAEMNGAWSEWKKKEPLLIMRDRIIGTAPQCSCGGSEAR